MAETKAAPEGKRPARRVSAAPEAAVNLDATAEALQAILPTVYEGVDVTFGVAVDEVTVVAPAGLVPIVCRIAKDHELLDFDYLRCLAAVDYEDRIEVSYHLFSLAKRHKMIVKTNVTDDDLSVPTVISVWRGADWFERETHDLFGVTFAGHPNLKPLLLYEGFEGHPGRKSFPFHEYTEY